MEFLLLKKKKDNFDFYEPRTAHDSSLSACIYSIIASEIGYHDKAYNLYKRASRLDLNDYNNDTTDGLHITSMSGSWMSIVMGFVGFRINNEIISFKPNIPRVWKRLSFKINVKERYFFIVITQNKFCIKLESGNEISIEVYEKKYKISTGKSLEVNINSDS